jgi:hypothetical protein
MANTGTVKVDGLKPLRRNLRRLGNDLSDLKDANQQAASIVASAGAGRAPKRSGNLAGSVRGNRAVGRAIVRAGGAAVPYAGPVHWGWPAHGIEAQPFIADAAVETQPVWLPAYEASIQKAVDKVGGTY